MKHFDESTKNCYEYGCADDCPIGGVRLIREVPQRRQEIEVQAHIGVLMLMMAPFPIAFLIWVTLEVTWVLLG